MTAVVTAFVFLVIACTPHDQAESETDRTIDADVIETTGREVLQTFVDQGFNLMLLTPDQRAFMDVFFDAWRGLTPNDQVFVGAFEELVLWRNGLTMKEFIADYLANDPTRIDTVIDANVERIAKLVYEKVSATPLVAPKAGQAPVFPWVVAIIAFALLGGGATAAYVIVANIQGKTCIEFCKNCLQTAAMACHEGAKVRCSCDGKVEQTQGGEFGSGAISKGTGTASSGYVCEYQCN